MRIIPAILFISALCYACGKDTTASSQDADAVYEPSSEAFADDILSGDYQVLTIDTLTQSLADLKEKTVGTSGRKRAGKILFDSLMNEASFADGDCFAIQIDDLNLRLHMLLNGQIDAAILPHPLADSAQAHGARVLSTYTVD